MIKNKITLKQLEALVYVADTGTFRKAAAALGTTQPNVSVRIATMEDTLQTVLMHRDAGSVQLTEKGAEILAAARETLRAAEALLEVAERQDLVEERLRLGVTELIASTWLHGFLRALKAEYPALRVELIVDLAVEIENQLAAGQLDLALLTEPFRTTVTGVVPLGSSRYGWIASPEMADQLPATPTIADLQALGIISHGKHTLASGALRKVLQDRDLAAERIVHSSSLTSCVNMVVDGMGIALVPRPIYRDRLAAGQVVELDCGWGPEPLRFFARYDAARAPLFVAKAAALSAKIAEAEER